MLRRTKHPNKEIELEHAKSFVDVVFGVLIALPLAETFPQLVSGTITTPSLSSGSSLLLLSATLVFSTFYWLEVRRFIDEQSKFDKAINAGGLSLGRLLGSLIMVALVGIILKFATVEKLPAFLIANLLFWLSDLLANIGSWLRYIRYNPASIKDTHPGAYEWFIYSFKLYKGPFYSSISVACYGLMLVADLRSHGSPRSIFLISLAIFVFTLVRHLILRVYL